MTDVIMIAMFIGFLSSAPMGPVGMLCVQRTLTEGRRSGLLTGFGAAVGDMIFAFIALIAALGLGFSTELIEKHEEPLQIFGSMVIIIFGVFVYRRNPSKNITQIKESKISDWKTFVSSLFLTISNVIVLFLYIGLFARFNIINTNNSLGYNLFTILFVGLGAMLWWTIISYFVNKLRNAFNPRGLKVFNKIIGSVLVIIGVVGIITALASINLLR